MDLAELNNRFAIHQNGTQLHFKSGGGRIPVVEIENEAATATISLQGAHLFSWQPTTDNGTNVIWMSEEATFAQGKSVRGGIPICWPWFGAHEGQNDYPAHGFARTTLWQVMDTKALSADETQITFKLQTEQMEKSIQTMWPWATTVEYRVIISKNLMLELVTTNNSIEPIELGQALHTYFNVDDITKIRVTGLEGKDYLDKTDGFKCKTQSGELTINAEVDRIYLQSPDDVVINDQTRRIHISKQGSRSTIVWNPWHDVALKMGDLGEAGYRKVLCVESANAAEDTVKILPGKSHRLQVCYEIETIA